MPLFALTNWSADLFPVALDRFDFLDLFEDIVVSGEEGVAKPDPEIFEVLEERVSHRAGLDDCIFIDDSPANVVAAAEQGWTRCTSPVPTTCARTSSPAVCRCAATPDRRPASPRAGVFE